MAYPRSGPASRAVALDLMLRTFMNSADFHTSNPKIWDNIAKLVPGTTPQQCAQRWEELRMSNSAVAGDLSGLTATGRPISGHGRRQISKFVRSMLNQPLSRHSHNSILEHTSSGYVAESRPHSVLSERSKSFVDSSAARPLTGQTDKGGGKFVANFCQTVLNGTSNTSVTRGGGRRNGGEGSDCRDTGKGAFNDGSTSTIDSGGSSTTIRTSSIGEHGPNMVIHVCDEAKKLKRDFVCPREILIQEMHYFAEYLSSDTQLWDEVDISVHCDVPVFDWLMRYTKRGMLEGPCGEKLEQPQVAPSLEPSNAVSILISSDFLKMDTLVELCLQYCHDNMSSVVAAPCNMGCIKDKLISRLGSKFTPIEAEGLVDKKDKIKSKVFLCQLEQMFCSTNSIPECPTNAATLFKCKHCGKLLTIEQQCLLPCVTERLSVDRTGKVVYCHEPDPTWDINKHIQSLQQREGLTPRDLYWRLWGIINYLECDVCHQVFQCCDLPTCAYHPQSVLVNTSRDGRVPQYMCCKGTATGFSALPHTKTGCAYHDHSVSPKRTSSSSPQSNDIITDPVYTILLQLRDTVCAERLKLDTSEADSVTVKQTQGHNCLEFTLLKSEERKPTCLPSGCVASTSSSHMASSVSADSIKGRESLSRQPLLSRQQSHDMSELEEDEDEPETRPSLPVQTVRQRRTRHTHPSILRQKHSRHDLQLPPPPVEWIWDSRKSKRWNQDMQRESDERRLATLESQLSKSLPQSNSSTIKSKETVGNTGGIFSRLEAQFRAEQAAKSLALQGHQSRNTSQGSGRRRF